MRDEALAQYAGGDGPDLHDRPASTIDWNTEDIAFRIEGMIEVPLFLDRPDPGGRMVYGDDGLPEQQGTAEYPLLA